MPEDEELDLAFLDTAQEFVELLNEYNVSSQGILTELDAFRLANFYVLLSNLESEVEAAREEVRDTLLEDVQDERRVDAEIGSIRRVSSKRRTLRNDEEVMSLLEPAGISRKEVSSLDQNKVLDTLDQTSLRETDIFEIEEYSYIMRIE